MKIKMINPSTMIKAGQPLETKGIWQTPYIKSNHFLLKFPRIEFLSQFVQLLVDSIDAETEVPMMNPGKLVYCIVCYDECINKMTISWRTWH